jgi:hypothetical protein
MISQTLEEDSGCNGCATPSASGWFSGRARSKAGNARQAALQRLWRAYAFDFHEFIRLS